MISAIMPKIGTGVLVLLGIAALGVACTSAQAPSPASTLALVTVPAERVIDNLDQMEVLNAIVH